MSERNVHIGGNATGNAIVTGDHNRTTLQFRQAALPEAGQVDIQAELRQLLALLQGLQTDKRGKIETALTEAAGDAQSAAPDREEVGQAVERALGYATQAADFADKADRIATHVQAVVGWLGSNWHRLLPLVGLTL